ncbi:MAG TPA: glycosyltransferase family 2 protein [Microbacterium sp.]|nr:glycosyltransferase family 2 protein [Microbacterium sp.]
MSDTSRRPTYSVVIPTHNVRPWLRQTLDSVLRQREDLEVIVVDDASTDGTAEFAREYAARDPRIRVIDNEGSGGGSARNLGAREAAGEYLVFADGDDLIPDGAYAALVGSLESTGSDMAVGDYLKFRAVDTWRPTAAMPAFGRPSTGVTLADEPSLLFSRPCWNRAFRVDFWRESAIEFPDVPRSNDIVPMVRALVQAQAIDVVEDIVYVYRERPGNGSMTARAGAATSLVSYLTQEAECARVIGAAGAPDIERVFSDLVWDRDGFVAVNRYLLAWSAPSEGDAEVPGALTTLLALVPAPSDSVGPLRAAVLRLAAAGEFAAAHALARVAGGHPEGKDQAEQNADLVATWRAAMAWIAGSDGAASAAEAAGIVLTNEERERIIERLARQLAQARHNGEPRVRHGADAVTWRKLLDEARTVLGPRAGLFATEAWQDPSGDRERDALRSASSARIDSLAGGTILAVDGTVAPGAGEVRVALFDGEAAIASGALTLIEASSTAWRTAEDGVRSFTAAFAAGSLPLHRPLTPVLMQGDAVWNIDATLELPPYSRHDSFLYDVVDRILVIRKRRHWSARGAIALVKRALRR